jgi:hypothetical protein
VFHWKNARLAARLLQTARGLTMERMGVQCSAITTWAVMASPTRAMQVSMRTHQPNVVVTAVLRVCVRARARVRKRARARAYSLTHSLKVRGHVAVYS